VSLDSPFNHVEQGKIVIPQMRYAPLVENEAEHLAEMAAYFREQVESNAHRGCWFCSPVSGRCSSF
jgi:ATP-dependent DNA helicase DinG